MNQLMWVASFVGYCLLIVTATAALAGAFRDGMVLAALIGVFLMIFGWYAGKVSR